MRHNITYIFADQSGDKTLFQKIIVNLQSEQIYSIIS